MKRILSFIFLAIIATACTGTKEVGVPRLIVVGSGGETSQLTLIQDVFFSDSTATNRFQFLKTLDLPAPPIASDVVDRELERSTLVIVSQNDTDTYLSFVNLAGINPEAPSEFKLSSSNLALSSLLAEGEVRPFAPVKLQVSKNGRYVALSNELATTSAIDIIDLRASGGPALLERFSDRILTSNFYLEQQESSSQLFFFIEQASGAVLSYFNLPSLSLNRTGFTLPNSRSDAPLDLQSINNQLLALQNDSFTPINSPTGTPTAGTPVSTLSDALFFIPTNADTLATILVLSSDELGAHRNLNSAVESTAFTATNGSIEPLGGFAYFVTDGASPIKLFDVQTYQNNPDTEVSRLVQSYTVANPADETTPISLTDTVFITWAISEPPLALP
ncbi:MAG: hypothetical protein KC422_13525 [Trueperaceae bacterium]|nr:hypothetical protein [Trueperaceae bacterium]